MDSNLNWLQAAQINVLNNKQKMVLEERMADEANIPLRPIIAFLFDIISKILRERDLAQEAVQGREVSGEADVEAAGQAE